MKHDILENFYQGCGAGAQKAILVDWRWSRNQTFLDGGAKAGNLGSGSTALICWEVSCTNNAISLKRTISFGNESQKL